MSNLRETFQTKDQVTSNELEKGLKFIIYDGICTQSMGALTGGAFLVAFALGLGASNFYIGLLAAIPFLAQTIQIPAVFLVEKVRARRGLSIIFSGVSRMFWYPIALIPILFVRESSAGLYLLIASLVLYAGLGAVAATSWNSWMRDLVPQDILGRFFSKRMMISTAIGVVLILIAGFVVDYWDAVHPDHQLYIYSILFIAGMAVGLYGLYFLWRTPEPDMKKKGEVPSMKSLFSQPLRDVNFRRLLIFSVPWSFAINLVTPFFTVYLLQRLGYSLSLVVGLSVLSQLTNIVFLRIWGRLSDRFSNKSILSVSRSFVSPVYPGVAIYYDAGEIFSHLAPCCDNTHFERRISGRCYSGHIKYCAKVIALRICYILSCYKRYIEFTFSRGGVSCWRRAGLHLCFQGAGFIVSLV